MNKEKLFPALYRGSFVYILCKCISISLSFSNLSTKKSVLNIESALHLRNFERNLPDDLGVLTL